MLIRALSPPSAIPPVPPGEDEARSQPDDVARVPSDRVSLPTPKLTPDEEFLIDELRARDREVRTHEAAHQSVGGALAGAASFTFQTGPDGRSYAIGGEVSISFSEGRTPQETIAIARQIRAAALAPADPSGQDLRVAQDASSLEVKATLDLTRESVDKKRTEQRGDHLHKDEPCAACSRATEKYGAPTSEAVHSDG